MALWNSARISRRLQLVISNSMDSIDYYDWCRCGYVLNRKPTDNYSDLMKDFDEVLNVEDDLVNFLSSIGWREFCADYGSRSHMFRCFKKLTEEKRCDASLMRVFLDTCGRDLANWVIHEGTVTSFSLILQHAHSSKFDLWKKRASTRRSVLPYYPVTECMYHGRWRNVDLLLSYGYNLEDKDFVHEKLVEEVFSEVAVSSEKRKYSQEVKLNINRRRFFFLFLVIWSYLNENDYPYKGCDAALKSIWKHLPDSYLTKDEFLIILDPVPANLSLLSELYTRYISTVCDGDYSLVLKPRTLAHYSRCTIRQTLGSNFSLPDGVHELPIPGKIKNYLLYK